MNLNNYNSKRSIIITGATSIIGISLINRALASKCIVYAIVRKDSKNKRKLPQDPNLKIIYGDLNNLDIIDMNGVIADCFYHLGWEGTTTVDRSDWNIQQKNIISAIDAAYLAKKTKCHTFIFAGSQAEYGTQEQTISALTEETPESAYGMSKFIAGESTKKICSQHNMTHIWTKIFSVFGPNDKSNTLINNMIYNFSNNLPMNFSSGKQKWEYIYEDDVGEILYRLGMKINNTSKFLISTGDSKPLKWYIETTKKIMESKSECIYSTNTPHGISSNPSDLWEQIEYWPRVTFSEGIKKILELKHDDKTKN